MAVERIDAQLQNIIAGVPQAPAQKEAERADGEADAARKAIEKKAAEKRDAQRQVNHGREAFQRQGALDQRMQQILGGAAGREAADALHGWQQNQQLQAKLTEAQKNLFQEAMAKSPARGTEAAAAMNRLSQAPGFGKAVDTAPAMGTLQQGLIENPKVEHQVAEVLQGRFMQAPKADPQSKNQFLRFAMQRAGQGQMESVRRAGDMLGSLAQHNVNRTAQRAAVAMVQRRPDDARAMGNVDAFVQRPTVGKLPSFARGKATELLARANGGGEVREGFEGLVEHPRFKAQSGANKGRFFSTIGSGKPSEFRALTDKALVALQSPGFPTRQAQVGRFLGQMSAQAQTGGAEAVDVGALVKQSRSSPLPKAPSLSSTAGLSDEEAVKVRAQNRARVIQFFTQLTRSYEGSERKLNNAKFFEDVNSLQNLRPAEELDTSMLSPEDQAFVTDRRQQLQEKLESLQKLQRQKARELRTKRMPLAKRKAMQEERRAIGRQPKYFSPAAGRAGASQVYLRAAAGAPPPRQGPPGADLNIQRQVADAVNQLRGGQVTAERVGQVAQTIAHQVANQVASQLTRQLMGSLGGAAVTQPPPSPAPAQAPAPQRGQQGKVDGWGIPRSFERDLGGADRAAVRPAIAEAPTHEPQAAALEPYVGKMLVKDPSTVRDLAALFPLAWKTLSRQELALLRNLGWNQQSWDTKDTPAAKWPMIMATPFVSLTPLQREAVRKLGITAADWDGRVQALAMGKNA